MLISKSDIRERYIDLFRELQWKNINDAQKTALLMILSAYFVNIFTENAPAIRFLAPFVSEIGVNDNPKTIVRLIEDGLVGKGNLAKGISEVSRINKDAITVLSRTIPQPHFGEIKETEISKIIEMQDRTNLIETSNRASVFVNRVIMRKDKKIWNTMRDSKVRRTAFHTNIDFKTADIDGLFENNGFFAYCPADSALPMWERLNCRCYLTFR